MAQNYGHVAALDLERRAGNGVLLSNVQVSVVSQRPRICQTWCAWETLLKASDPMLINYLCTRLAPGQALTVWQASYLSVAHHCGHHCAAFQLVTTKMGPGVTHVKSISGPGVSDKQKYYLL